MPESPSFGLSRFRGRLREQEASTGWKFGDRGSLSARLYDKTLEIVHSDKGYWRDVWRELGWDGEQSVWRLEFEFGRNLLRQLSFDRTAAVVEHLGSLWVLATTDWLRLTEIGRDSNRARWQTAPIWEVLSHAEWADEPDRLNRSGPRARVPSDDWLFVNGLGPLISFMAREGIAEVHRAMPAFVTAAARYHDHRRSVTGFGFAQYVDQKLALKRRQYNVSNLSVECEGVIAGGAADAEDER